jgi:hypothetical protein
MSGYKPGGLTQDDYIYALEVAGMPAKTKNEKSMKSQAKKDVKYLEAKFPKYTAKNKSFSSRMNQPTHTGGKKKATKSKTQKSH